MKYWALKRQLVGLSIFSFVFVLLVVGLVSYLSLRPTCNDGKQNGAEEGVDCGRSCPNACLGQVREPAFLWSRFFLVKPGIYDAGALVENFNLDVGSRDISYTFKLYDADGVLLARTDGKTYMYPAQQTFIFAPNLSTSGKQAARVDFTVNSMSWERFEKRDPLEISVLSRDFDNTEFPRVSVELENRSLFEEPLLEISVLLKKADDTVYAASRSYVQGFASRTKRTVTFTWPNSLFESPAHIELLYRRVLR